MWTTSSAFRNELRRDSHTVAIKAEVLDTSRQPVIGGTFYDPITAKWLQTNQFQNIIIDGSVEVDTTRDTQRTFTLTILNSNGEFSPDSTWSGLFYVNRLIRLWRGLFVNGYPEFVPIGTFLIDSADVIVERNMSTVVLSGSDGWKRFSKALITGPGSYASGTSYNSIIAANAALVGISGSAEIALDPLADRDAAGKVLSKALAYERGDNRGELLSTLCKNAGIDIWFDPMGVLRTQDMRTAKDAAVVWQFYDGDGGMLLSAKRAFSDDSLYNKVLCVGTGSTTTTYSASKGITDPAHPLSIDKIGERTKIIESRGWSTQAQVDAAAARYWDDYRVIDEAIEADVICNPALEGNDVVSIRETTFTDLGTEASLTGRALRLVRMTVPLSSSRSRIMVNSKIRIG